MNIDNRYSGSQRIEDTRIGREDPIVKVGLFEVQPCGRQCIRWPIELNGLEDYLKGLEDSLQGSEDSLQGSEDCLQGGEDCFKGLEDCLRGSEERL